MYQADKEYLKPEDWKDFETAFPEAAAFIEARSLYREYLQLRIDICRHGSEKVINERIAAITPLIETTPTSGWVIKPQPPAETRTDSEKFFSGLSEEGRLIIFETALKGLYDGLKFEDKLDLDLSEDVYLSVYYKLNDFMNPPENRVKPYAVHVYRDYAIYYVIVFAVSEQEAGDKAVKYIREKILFDTEGIIPLTRSVYPRKEEDQTVYYIGQVDVK